MFARNFDFLSFLEVDGNQIKCNPVVGTQDHTMADSYGVGHLIWN